MYRQCLLRLGKTRQIAWIPAQFARVGAYIKLVGQNGWQVEAAWGRSDGEWLDSGRRGYRREFGSLA
jgi:hypothetical protein